MTVRELIEELESVYDKNMRVTFCSDGEEYEPIYQIVFHILTVVML